MLTLQSHIKPPHTLYGHQEDVRKHFRELGLKSLGNGTFAEVYELPSSSNVLKVFVQDNSYLTYAQALEDRVLEGPHFPHIDRLTRYVDEEEKPMYYTVEVERLEPLFSNSECGKPGPDKWWRGLKVTSCYDISDLASDIEHYVYNVKNFTRISCPLVNMYLKDSEIKALEDLGTFVRDKRVGLDLNGGHNCMLRGDDLVITDPFAW